MNDLSRLGDTTTTDAAPLAPLDALAALLRLVADPRYHAGTVSFEIGGDHAGQTDRQIQAVLRTPCRAGKDAPGVLVFQTAHLPNADTVLDRLLSIDMGIEICGLDLRWEFDENRLPVPASRRARHHPFEAVADEIFETLNTSLAPGICREVRFQYQIHQDPPQGRRQRGDLITSCRIDRIAYRDDTPAARQVDNIARLQTQMGRLAARVARDRDLVEFDHPYLNGVRSITIVVGCGWDMHGRRILDRAPLRRPVQERSVSV